MMNKEQKIFLKENWFRISIIVVILILSLVLYQGLVVGGKSNSPKQETSNIDTLKLSMQCRDDGERKLQEDKNMATSEKYKTGIVNCYYMEPAFIFNHSLNTCLYSGGYTCDLVNVYKEGFSKGEHVKQWERHIVDIYSNKTLASVYIEDSSNISDWVQTQISDFWNKSAELGF